MTKKNIIIATLGVVLALSAVFYFGQSQDVQTVENRVVVEEAPSIDNSAVVVEQNGEIVATTTVETKKAEESVVVPVAAKSAVSAPAPTKTETMPVVVTEPAPEPVEPSGITMADLRTHADASSCWSVVDGSVYDLTSYIPKHPGGKSEILSICGTDGSSAFSGQHEGESKPERILASYKIGVLAN